MSDDIFATPGEMGARMAAHDWAASPVGPVGGWPQSLRAGVRLILRSRYPMILTWGPAYTQFYNDAYSELIGDRHPGALGGDIRETLAEGWDVLGPLIEDAMSTGIATWVPALRLLMDRAGYREEAYFDVSHAPMADDDGRVVGMFAVCAEVTEQVVGERRLRLLRELSARTGEARAAQEAVDVALEVLGGHPLDVPFAAVYQRDGDVLRRAGSVGIDGALPESARQGEESWGLAAAAGGADDVVVGVEGVDDRATVAGGPWGDAVHSALAFPIAGGALLVGVSPNRALDERHRDFFSLLAGQVSSAIRSARAREGERRRAEALAELDRAKTDFFANVSHEFRTPLTLLLGPLDDALADREAPLAPAQRERVEVAARNARRMLKLVNGLLDFSRLQAGAWKASLRRVDLAQVTADQASVFRSTIERAGLRFVVDCAPVGDDVAVDPEGWEQIVSNLLSNAFKFTFTGEIRVTLRRAGDAVTLTVADTGVGIAAEQLARLFERFHRVDGARSRTHEGTGVGLALVRDFAEVHGGHADVESVLGRGSTFSVTIPAGAVDAPAADRAGASPRAAMAVEEAIGWEAAPGAAPSAADATVVDGPRVLIADDNADMRAYAERILRARCRVRTVVDGQAALEAVRADPPDLVLSDVMMPRMDGFALLRALRGDPATAGIPVVLLSARSGPEAAVEGLRRGADDYLVKPFAAQELLARVLANASRGRREGAAVLPAASAPSGLDAAPVESIEAVREGAELRLRMPARAGALRHLRRHLRAFLSDAAIDPDEADGLLVAACEAATNAIEHAEDPIAAIVELGARAADGRVRIDVRDFGRWRPRGPSLDRGRGSALMEAYADVRVMPSPEGTLVSLTSRPAG